MDVCIHFAGRRISKVRLTSFSERLSLQIPKIKTAVAQLTTRQQKQSLQERTAGLSLLTHGDFISNQVCELVTFRALGYPRD